MIRPADDYDNTTLDFEDEDESTVFQPSQERIQRLCREFQKSWSAREFRKRSVTQSTARWLPPEISMPRDLETKLLD